MGQEGHITAMDDWKNLDQDFCALFQLSRDAVLGCRDGRVVFANAAAEGLLGAGCVGAPLSELLPEGMSAWPEAAFVSTLTLRGQPFSLSGVRRGDMLLLLLVAPEEDASAIPVTVLTELRSTAQNLRLAAELVAQHLEGDEAMATHASILRRSSFATTRLCQNLADAAALDSGELTVEMELLNLASLCRDLVDSVRFFIRDKNINLRCTGCGEPVYVSGSRMRLEQLLLNLLSNALEHTTAGDTITVDLTRRGERAVLSVDDDGEGIHPSQMNSLFLLHRSGGANLSGAGLGLHLAQGIARLHGGVMLVESREGEGTCARVMLPVSTHLPLHESSEGASGAGLILRELSSVISLSYYASRYLD